MFQENHQRKQIIDAPVVGLVGLPGHISPWHGHGPGPGDGHHHGACVPAVPETILTHVASPWDDMG